VRTKEGQRVKTAEHQILTRIGFAERWLQRAREECLDGDVGRGLLTLVLADAEVRRLLQLAVPPAPRPRWRRLPLVATAAGLVVAVVMALQLGVPALRAAPAESAGLAPGLLLRPGTGVLLIPLEAAGSGQTVEIVSVARSSTVASPVHVRRSMVRRAAGSVSPGPAQEAVVPAAQKPQPAPPRLFASPPPPQTPIPAPTPAAVPAVTPAPAHSASLSVADLLDLVIVADRTLRRSQP
jgi:hypothetical protein